MSQKIKAPNQKSSGFLWGLVAIVVIAVVVIAVVVIQGRDSKDVKSGLAAADVNFNVSVEDGDILVRGESVPADAPAVDIYEDYSCHYCADLVEADHVSLKDALDNSKLSLRLNDVNFLAGGADGHSTLGGIVAYAIAETGNAGAFWAYHDWAYLNRTEITGYSLDDFADSVEKLGVDAATVSAIRDGSARDKYQPMLESNYQELISKEGDQAGTPALYVNGTKFDIKKNPDDPTKMADWVPDVVK